LRRTTEAIRQFFEISNAQREVGPELLRQWFFSNQTTW